MPETKPPTRPPWEVQFDPLKGFWISHDPRVHGDMKRGLVVICDIQGRGQEAEANARLIAAVHHMHSALTLARDIVQAELEWHGAANRPELAEAEVAILAAFARIEGKAE